MNLKAYYRLLIISVRLNTVYKYLIKYDRLSDEAKDIMKEKIHEIETELIKRVETDYIRWI